MAKEARGRTCFAISKCQVLGRVARSARDANRAGISLIRAGISQRQIVGGGYCSKWRDRAKVSKMATIPPHRKSLGVSLVLITLAGCGAVAAQGYEGQESAAQRAEVQEPAAQRAEGQAKSMQGDEAQEASTQHEAPCAPAKARPKAAQVVVVKSQRLLRALADDGCAIMQVRVSISSVPEGAKIRRGDRKTPEGLYVMDYKKRASAYYRAIHINYPTPEQAKAARAAGIDPGSDILVHGPPMGPLGPMGMEASTEGCIQLSAVDMDLLWEIVERGTPIHIKP